MKEFEIYMITLKITHMRSKPMAKSGKILAGMHVGLRDIIKPGISELGVLKNFVEVFLKNMMQLLLQIRI